MAISTELDALMEILQVISMVSVSICIMDLSSSVQQNCVQVGAVHAKRRNKTLVAGDI